MEGQMDGWTEFLPCVLQDIVPYWVRCKYHLYQGKGTADLLMPLGDLFYTFSDTDGLPALLSKGEYAVS